MDIQEDNNFAKSKKSCLIPENILPWWDDGYAVEKHSDIYRNEEGCLDHFYLEKLFSEIDKRIYRVVRNRMKPGYGKVVDGHARMYVGNLSSKQFYSYIERLQSSVRCSKIREHSFKVPSCNFRTYQYESILFCEWKDGKLPHLSVKNNWAYAKWFDGDAIQVHRAYATKFTLTHNSYTECVSVRFEYVFEFFRVADGKWVVTA